MLSNKKVLLSVPPYFGMDISIARAFRKNGVEPVLAKYRLSSSFWERLIRKFMETLHCSRKAVQPLMKYPLIIENKNFIRIAEKYKPSFIFIVKGENLFPQTIKYLKNKMKVPCISYQWDDPFYSSEDKRGIDDYRRINFENSMHDYDQIFVFDMHYAEEIKIRGVTNVSYLPLATDEEVYRSIELTDAEKDIYGYDVCFVGMPYQNRLETLNSLKDFNIGVFGDYWERYLHKMKGNYFKGKASDEKVLKLYVASKIVLNIHHPQSVYGLNTRTFDIPSCGSFEIVDYKHGLQELFDIGKEIICYQSIDELIDLVHYFLDHPEDRKRIAEKGYSRVRRQHTWYHRMKEVMAFSK